MSIVTPRPPNAVVTVASAGVTAAPTAITDGITCLGLTSMLVKTVPNAAITDINFTVHIWTGGGAGSWGTFVASGALAPTLAQAIVMEGTSGAERVAIQTTVAAGGGAAVGYILTFMLQQT